MSKITPVGRVAYEDLYVAKDFKGDQRFKFSATLIWEKTAANEKKVEAMISDIMLAGKAKFAGKLPSRFQMPIEDGDAQDNERFHGHWYARFSSKHSPTVLGVTKDENGKRERIGVESGRVFAGVYGAIAYEIYCYDNQSKGASLNLNSFLLVSEGEPFVTRSDPDEDFSDFDSFGDVPGSANDLI